LLSSAKAEGSHQLQNNGGLAMVMYELKLVTLRSVQNQEHHPPLASQENAAFIKNRWTNGNKTI
jgi:hypothetical protein